MKTKILTAAFILLIPSAAWAQSLSEACNAGVPPYIVTTGKAPTITWLVPATVADPANPTTTVPYIVDGFSYQVTPVGGVAGARVELLPKPVAGTPCGVGTAGTNAGMIPYMVTLGAGASKGSYTLRLFLWYFNRTIDPATGNVVVGTTKQEAFVDVPFVAADPIYTGPPLPPKNVRIYK